MKKLLLLLLILNLFQRHAIAQNLKKSGERSRTIDSILNLVKTEKGDTNKVNHLNIICQKYTNIGQYDSALYYGNTAFNLGEKIKFPKGIANANNNFGNIYLQKGDYPKALANYFKALKVGEELGDKDRIAKGFWGIGLVYLNQGNHLKALEYYFKSLNIMEELENKNGIASILGNIGNVYRNLHNYSKALEYCFKALKINEELGNKNSISKNIGNIGIVYYNQSDYPKALEYFFKTLKIQEELGDKSGIVITLGNIGALYNKQKKYDEAEKYLLKAIALAKKIGVLNITSQFEESISELYFTKGDYKKAYEHHQQYSMAKDSLFNIEKYDDITRKEMNYEYEKKEAIAKAEQEKQAAVSAAESKKQKIIIWSVVIGLLLVVVFAIFIFLSLRSSQKQKRIIEEQKQVVENQKHLVEEKHKEISDSINYAERIQRALLASKNLLDENLSDYFILFKPKDVVSGDFYWATKLNNNHFALVIADSTGHGVPGAIMSILNIACLKEAVGKSIISPDLLLNETRRLVIENLKNDGSLDGGKDGMDGSLLSFDFKNNIMYCALANNPIWIIRTGNSSAVENTCELIEIKADRMPIGKHDKDKTPFTLHTLNLQKGDVVYTLTDGFPDQFGGESGKKFKYKQLQELLLSISQEPMDIQKQKLNDVFDNWRGNLEQVDDVCIIGIRV